MSGNLDDSRREFDRMVHGLRVVFFVLFALPLVTTAFILMAAVLNQPRIRGNGARPEQLLEKPPVHFCPDKPYPWCRVVDISRAEQLAVSIRGKASCRHPFHSDAINSVCLDAFPAAAASNIHCGRFNAPTDNRCCFQGRSTRFAGDRRSRLKMEWLTARMGVAKSLPKTWRRRS